MKWIVLVAVIITGGLYYTGYQNGLSFQDEKACKSFGKNKLAAGMAIMMMPRMLDAMMAGSDADYFTTLGARHGLEKAVNRCLISSFQ